MNKRITDGPFEGLVIDENDRFLPKFSDLQPCTRLLLIGYGIRHFVRTNYLDTGYVFMESGEIISNDQLIAHFEKNIPTEDTLEEPDLFPEIEAMSARFYADNMTIMSTDQHGKHVDLTHYKAGPLYSMSGIPGAEHKRDQQSDQQSTVRVNGGTAWIGDVTITDGAVTSFTGVHTSSDFVGSVSGFSSNQRPVDHVKFTSGPATGDVITKEHYDILMDDSSLTMHTTASPDHLSCCIATLSMNPRYLRVIHDDQGNFHFTYPSGAEIPVNQVVRLVLNCDYAVEVTDQPITPIHKHSCVAQAQDHQDRWFITDQLEPKPAEVITSLRSRLKRAATNTLDALLG